MTASSKWKKALLPTLGNRRKDRSPTGRLPASRTVHDFGNKAAKNAMDEQPSDVDDDLDDRLISELLGTTAGPNDGDALPELQAQPRRVNRSHTVGVMSSSGRSSTSVSPYRVQKNSSTSPGLRRKPSKRNLQAVMRDAPKLSPRRSPDGLVRPLCKSQSSNLLGSRTHQMGNSISMSLGRLSGRRLRDNTVRNGARDAAKISRSVTSALAAANDHNGSATDSIGSTATSTMGRFKRNKMFAKFTGALAEHFNAKSSRKDDKLGGSIPVGSDRFLEPITHGLPLGRLTLDQLPLTDNGIPDTANQYRFAENGGVEDQEGALLPSKGDTGLSMPRKRLTLVDEIDSQDGHSLDDPFSEASSGHQSTEFDARLRSVQVPGIAYQYIAGKPVSDPFLDERILDTSANSILRTPPVGCSTPRYQSVSSARRDSPTQSFQAYNNPATGMIMISPGRSPSSSQQRRKVMIICESPTRASTSPGKDQKENGSGGNMAPLPKAGECSDTTRLSSYPPGRTIRHVPRSMGRLADIPDLQISTTGSCTSPPVGRKKHPSPNKGQLDLYGRFIEKNLALGVFQDPDELAMNLDPPRDTSSPVLSSRDKNRLIRGSVSSNIDVRKNDKSAGPLSGLSTNSRSRIPQPVRHLSRSRTESAFARDFRPANHGDSTTEDELQCESSVYKVGRRRDSRCHRCGSMAEEAV